MEAFNKVQISKPSWLHKLARLPNNYVLGMQLKPIEFGEIVPWQIETELLIKIIGYCTHRASLVCKIWKGISDTVTTHIQTEMTVEDEQLIQLSLRFPNLQYLDVRGNFLLTEKSVGLLTRLISLKLGMSNRFGDETVSKLTNLTSLRASSSMSDVSLSLLTNLRQLDACIGRKFTDASMSKLTNLTHLVINTESITDHSFFQLTKLSHLTLKRTHTVTDESLSRLTNLIYLHLVVTEQTTDRTISCLTGLNNLKLTSPCLFISQGGMKPFGFSPVTDISISLLTNLTSLYTDGACSISITDKSISLLPKVKVNRSPDVTPFNEKSPWENDQFCANNTPDLRRIELDVI